MLYICKQKTAKTGEKMLKMYTGVQDEEYKFIDSVCEEQYLVGGVTAWIYAYLGPKGSPGSTDSTEPDYETLGSKITDIGNLIWMENSDRSYSIDAVSVPVIYQVQDANMDFQIPGLFLFETMDITLPYNLMIRTLGRKIMNGDVIELANLRDSDLLDVDSKPINRFYVVQDAFKAAIGYSHTWLNHIFKIRLVPITDSPEFRDILGTGKNEDDLTNHLSTHQRELAIMDTIIGQADSEVPFMHWDNEHIHGSLGSLDNSSIPTGYDYPPNPKNGMFFIKKNLPELYEWEDAWIKVQAQYGDDHSYPTAPQDGDFFWVYSSAKNDFTLEQYEGSKHQWRTVIVQYFETLPILTTDSGFAVIKLPNSKELQYNEPNDTWDPVMEDKAGALSVSNKFNPQDQRENPYPNEDEILKGTQFPQSPVDGTWFLRTDLVPQTLWKYEDSKWRKYNYGGRFQWTGTDAQKASYINNRSTIDDSTVPSRQSSNNTLKKG